MSQYKISELVDDRVLNYRFSVDSKTDPEYIKLKDSVKEHNKMERVREDAGLEPHYLRVRGRGRNPKVSGPQNRQSVTDANASYFDVYVQRDGAAMQRYLQRRASTKVKSFVSDSIAKMSAVLRPVSVGA